MVELTTEENVVREALLEIELVTELVTELLVGSADEEDDTSLDTAT